MVLLAALSGRARERVLRCVVVTVALNLVSHTAFWIGFPALAPVWPGGLVGAEGVVVVVEAIAYRYLCPFGWWLALSASLLLNFLSFALGVEVGRLWR